MLKPCFRTMFALIAIAGAAALAAPAGAETLPGPNESPWAMRAPTPVPMAGAKGSVQMTTPAKSTPEQQQLAHKMALAMYAKDYAALKQLIAPSTMKCIGKNQNFLDDRLRRQFELPISKDYHLTVLKLPPNLMRDTKFATYPIAPTYVVGMEFVTPEGSNVTVNEMIGQENGKWYEVQPCPTELGMEQFAKRQQTRAQYRDRAKPFVAHLQEPLKSQMMAYITKRDNVDALNLCMNSLHVDIQTAHEIVRILAGDEPN